MEVAWQQAYVAAYASEASCALQRFIAGERDPDFVAQALQLVRTYLAIPAQQRQQPATDLAIAHLARAMQQYLHDRGYWHDITALWPVLSNLVHGQQQPQLYTELMKQLGIIHDRQGDQIAAAQLYTRLINDSVFRQVPLAMQIDVRHQFGTMLVWQGKLRQARQTLEQVLTHIAQHPVDPTARNEVDCYGARASFHVTPLWESKAYTLNQLGNIAMFQGKFAQAEALYKCCWETLIQHGEADNLACVAHQALGRLWTHWQQPAKARPLLVQGIAIRRRRQDEEGTAVNLLYLADAALQIGAMIEAEQWLNAALPILQAIGDRRDLALCHFYFGHLAWTRGKQGDACLQWQQGLDYLQTVHMPLVEQAPLSRHLLDLLFSGEWALFLRATKQFIQTMRQQKLTGADLWRLYKRFKGIAGD